MSSRPPAHRRRPLWLLALAFLVLVLGAAPAAAGQDALTTSDATSGYDHVNDPPSDDAFSSVDWCLAFADPSVVGETISITAEGPSGPVTGEGLVQSDGTVKVRLGITEGGTYRATSITALESGRSVDPASVDEVDVVFDPALVDCGDTLTAAPPPPPVEATTSQPPVTTGSPTTSGQAVPTPPPASTQTGGDPAPTGGGSDFPWVLVFGGGLLLLLLGAGLWFAPASRVAGPKYDYKVLWTTKTNEQLAPLATKVLKDVGKGSTHVATYRVTVATRLRKIEPNEIVSESGKQKWVPRHQGFSTDTFLMSWSKGAAASGDGTLTTAHAGVNMSNKGQGVDEAKVPPKTPGIGPIETRFELVEDTFVKVELVELTERFHHLLSKSHEFFGKAQSTVALRGVTSADTGLHNSAPPVFELEPSAAAAVMSSLSGLNYSAKETEKLKRSLKGKLSELKGSIEKSEVALGVGPFTIAKFSLGLEGGTDSANKGLSADFEGGPAIHQPNKTELAASVSMVTELDVRSKISPDTSSNLDRHAKTWTSDASAEVHHQVILEGKVDPAKFTPLANDEEETCQPSLRLSLGRARKLPAGTGLSADFDKEKWDTKAPFDGRLWIPAGGNARRVFDLDAPAFHVKPGVTSSGRSKDLGLTMEPATPKRPAPEPDETIKCWTAENNAERRLGFHKKEKARRSGK